MSSKSSFRSRDGCVICGRKSSTSRFKSSEAYGEYFPAAFGIEFRRGDFCNPCSLALNRFKKTPEGKRRNFSARVDKCRRSNGKGGRVLLKGQRKQKHPTKRKVGPVTGSPFPNTRPLKHRRKHGAMPDAPWMKYTNMWRQCTLNENGLEYSALANDHLKIYLINVESARPCNTCQHLNQAEDWSSKQAITVPPTALPTNAVVPLPPSPSTSSVDEDKNSTSSPSTPSSFKENLAPGLEEEMEVDTKDINSATHVEAAASALMTFCNVQPEMYRQKDTRYLRAASNQGMASISVGCMP